MSDEAMAAHLSLLKSRACARVMADIQMLDVGVPMTPEMLVDRWVTSARVEGIERHHLEAVRRQVALDYHPDRQGGSARLMTIANAALDAALTEIDRLTALDVRIIECRRAALG